MQFLVIFATLGLSLVLATVELALYKLWTGYLSRGKQASWAQVPLAA